MSSTSYSLINLWPEFSRLMNGDITSPEGLSALFVALLFVMALSFVSLSLINYFRARSHLRFYQNLIKGLTLDQLLEKRRDLSNAAMKHPGYGRLWREFDESLVHIPQKQRLCNTLDAAHFFNTHTLARGLTENRLLAAVPGFLTAIGVIGTFAGLQLGLGPLGDLDPEQAKVDELTHGIFGMIGGASIAFMTSVWGVFTSVAFNFFEKFLERNIRSSIASFQNDVDYLYPRITAEQSLAHIEDFTRQSNDRLAELDEKIGNKMQEAMREASGVISDSLAQSLNTILGPAVEQLVNNAHSGSEKALESLLDRFLQGVGSAGDAQKAMMEQASQDMASASGEMAKRMQSFADSMESQISSMMTQNADALSQVNSTIQAQLDTQNQREAERQAQMTSNLQEFMSGLKGQLNLLAQQNAETLKAVQGELTGQLEQQQAREIARQELLQGQLKGFQEDQARVTQGIEDILSAQKAQNTELLSGLSALTDRFQRLASSHETATSAMQGAASELKAGSVQLGLLSSNIKTAIDTLGDQLAQAIDSADTITKENAETAALFDEVVSELRGTGEQIGQASSRLGDAATKAEHGFSAVNSHFDALGKSLQNHVAALEKQVADLLSDYADRVQSQTVNRLNTWNEQTNSYISSMTDAVRTLSSVVDEMDSKVSSHRVGSPS
ncbi:anti-phage ZorAB system protein ZorA [Pseudomaricurvus sp. HS19]|uniref:anti-phage ZorAB system protein ZorA n=1 Tax=Pseudomaricurvus sp. HS19 TaxID=2692626 RepID=UPI00136B880A|nr:anti-phage ZorAB system protein ZorA [Pseudomaricurvus sp. HS19]MYM64490.1 anti-phage defense ZorAB system ZorA [Pseudomaricurvus sp. HS19]